MYNSILYFKHSMHSHGLFKIDNARIYIVILHNSKQGIT